VLKSIEGGLHPHSKIKLTSCLAQVETALAQGNLFPVEQKIARYILENPGKVVRLAVQELADETGASRATIVRFCQTLGYTGYRDFKLALAGQAPDTLALELTEISATDDVMSIARKVFQSDLQAIADSLQVLDATEMKRAVEVLDKATRIELYGLGSSASTTLDAYYRFLRLGLPVNIVSDPYMQAIVSAQLRPGQVAFAISHSGRTEEVIFALSKAKEVGATTICLTSNARGDVLQYADIRLVTAAREGAFRSQGMASRITHLSVVDALYVNLALRNREEAARLVLKSDEVVEERRRLKRG
jgi:RpiR family transcriptional regulator, carbohydrate utilization regulator